MKAVNVLMLLSLLFSGCAPDTDVPDLSETVPTDPKVNDTLGNTDKPSESKEMEQLKPDATEQTKKEQSPGDGEEQVLALTLLSELPPCGSAVGGRYAFVTSSKTLFECKSFAWNKVMEGLAEKKVLLDETPIAPGVDCPNGGVKIKGGRVSISSANLLDSEAEVVRTVCEKNPVLLPTPTPTLPPEVQVLITFLSYTGSQRYTIAHLGSRRWDNKYVLPKNVTKAYPKSHVPSLLQSLPCVARPVGTNQYECLDIRHVNVTSIDSVRCPQLVSRSDQYGDYYICETSWLDQL